MLGPIVRHQIGAAERKLGVPLDYLREMYAQAPDAFWAFNKLPPLAGYRKTLPPAPFHLARVVATHAEDCGSCVQLVVNQARHDGVEPELLRAALEGRPDDLPESLADVYRFAEAVATRAGDPGPCRDRLLAVFGPEGVTELAIAVAVCRVFPAVKRALGHAVACSATPITV